MFIVYCDRDVKNTACIPVIRMGRVMLPSLRILILLSCSGLCLRRLFPFALLGLMAGMVVCYSFPLSLYVCFSFSA